MNNTNKGIETRRGRHKRPESENVIKRFNLVMNQATMEALIRIAAQKQLKTGQRISITGLINSILDNYETKGESLS